MSAIIGFGGAFVNAGIIFLPEILLRAYFTTFLLAGSFP
jgi:hypothetical protein